MKNIYGSSMREKYLDYEVLKIADDNIFSSEFVV
jgi:hypothetical protein